MRFRELLFLLAALTTVTGLAMASDRRPSPEPQQSFFISANGQNELNSQLFSLPNQSGLVGGGAYRWRAARLGTINPQAVIDHDLCYTMRTYKVKPTEHLADNESGFRGYSSCQLASTFQLRSADAPQGQKGTKSK